MINKFLFWLTARLPCRLIKIDDRPYLERYYLGQILGVTFYLHRFVSSDSERHVHNHPWEWARSLIICGDYIEERVIDICPHANDAGCWTKYRKVRWFNRVNCNTFHRIHRTKIGTWSLFFHNRRVRIGGMDKGWGFLKSTRWHVSEGAMDMQHTEFVPYPHSTGEWWRRAKTGAEIGREPL